MSNSIHASAVLVGARALLIHGPSGSGKSRLVLSILEAARCGHVPFARLVGDDRVLVEAAHGRLIVRPAPALAGMIEVRGFGVMRTDYEPVAAVGWVVELAADDAARLPEAAALVAEVEGIKLPRLPVADGRDPLPPIIAFLRHSGQAKASSSA